MAPTAVLLVANWQCQLLPSPTSGAGWGLRFCHFGFVLALLVPEGACWGLAPRSNNEKQPANFSQPSSWQEKFAYHQIPSGCEESGQTMGNGLVAGDEFPFC